MMLKLVRISLIQTDSIVIISRCFFASFAFYTFQAYDYQNSDENFALLTVYPAAARGIFTVMVE